MRTALAVLLIASLAWAGAARRVKDDQGCDKGIDENNELDGEIVCTRDGVKHYEGMYAHGKRVGVAKTWRDDGKLASVVHFVDGAQTGLAEEYRRDGTIEESCEYKNDKKDGPCKLYGPEGKLWEERRYVAGEQRGPWTSYHRNGKVLEKGTLDETGRPHGLRERFRENGAPESSESYAHGEKDGVEKEWHPNGKQSRELNWKAGKQHGLSKTWHENGQLASVECYQNGESKLGAGPCTGQTGPEVVTRWFPDGKPYETTAVKNGKKNGERQVFASDGTLRGSESYVDDVLDGLEKSYEGGKLKHQLTWKAGKKTGPETTFFEDGKTAEETVWRDGRRQSHTTWWMNGKKKLAESLDGELWHRATWHDTGQQATEDAYREGGYGGRREGVERRWSEAGILVQEGQWKAGKRSGTLKLFFEKTGKRLAEEEWADDVRTARKEWDEQGVQVKDERYNADGSRK